MPLKSGHRDRFSENPPQSDDATIHGLKYNHACDHAGERDEEFLDEFSVKFSTSGRPHRV